MGYILATGYQYKKSCRAFLRLPGYWQPFIVVFGLALHHARGDVEAATAHARRHPPSKNAHRLDEDAAYAPTRAARENERKRARSCARHLLCSRNVVLRIREAASRLLAHRPPPSSAVPRRSPAADALRSLLALRSSTRLAATSRLLVTRLRSQREVARGGVVGVRHGLSLIHI